MLLCVCSPQNDLYQVLTQAGGEHPRYATLEQALSAAPRGAAVLALAESYPRAEGGLNPEQLAQIKARGLRLYLEYPASLPDRKVGQPQATHWERVIIAGDWFAPELPPLTILAVHGCWYLPMQGETPQLVVAKVAGYRTAVYGLPSETWPILFQLPGHDVLIATTKLSQFVTARYGPSSAWRVIWSRLLRWLAPDEPLPTLAWSPTVGLQASRDEPLPPEAERNAFRRSVKWFREHIVYSVDWKKGALEGYEGIIDYEGRQMPRAWARGDCTAETALVFACDWAVQGNPASRRLAGQILDYVWSAPDFLQDDPASPVYGLNNWGERLPVFYGDDNARVILPTLAARRLLGETRWDEQVLRCLLANLRTTGPLGFRHASLRYPESFPPGRDWRYYRADPVIHYAPHYQAYLWAAFLWAYGLTGYEGFLHPTKTAIRMTMAAYPGQWRWTNGLTQEMARMLLPLAFLVRLEDTPEHRGWLWRIAGDLLAQMQPCGAIQERLGELDKGSYPPPRSNEAYGTNEASLLQENGDPACDLLYTTNYAFLALHEAAAVTGDETLKRAEDRLAEFLCRIQVRSAAHPYLDGAWMRSFDYELWEYWGSSADAGWGAWCVESVWTNTWIAAVLALRTLNETLWNTQRAESLRERLPALIEEMLPD